MYRASMTWYVDSMKCHARWPASRYSLYDFKAICTPGEQHREMTVKLGLDGFLLVEDIRSTNKHGGDQDTAWRKLEVAVARCNPARCHVGRRHRRQSASSTSDVALSGACSHRRPHPFRLNTADFIGVYDTLLPRRASRIATDLVTIGIDSHIDAAVVVHWSRRSWSRRVLFLPHRADACLEDRQR
ncbi:unnamed protein product [Closterium sp. NIES-54]